MCIRDRSRYAYSWGATYRW